MKSSGSIGLTTKYKLSLVLLALVGAVFVLLSTSRYGAGLSPDSVGYIGIARNLIKGAGFRSYNGNLTVKWPPLYPALLALVGGVFGTDPLLLVNDVNALIFGLIVYVGGVLTFKHFSSFPALAFVGTLAILVSRPLFAVSVMAWTESLFIFFVLLSLILADSYLSKKDTTSLILFSSSVALSALIRYVGVTLILWGALVIVIFLHRDNLKNRIAHLSLFTLISALPVGIWLIRNYAISRTLFGSRASSVFTLSQNLTFMFNSLLEWYIPLRFIDHRSILVFLIATAGFLAGLSLKDNWQSVKVSLRQISPTVLFVITYIAFLIISSTTTAYDRIGDRLLSPIYVPLTLLLLILAQAIVEPYQRRFSKKIVSSILIIGILIWLVYPVLAIMLNVVNLTQNGRGYNSKTWKDSETIQYLVQHQTIESECTVYTNGPDATYILAYLSAELSPDETRNNSPEIGNDISRLMGSWPKESKACLVWFDRIDRTYLFTIDELQTVVNIDQITRLEDGSIYSITRK